MCGIAGVFTSRPTPTADLEAFARKMADAIAYRGPDDWGTWAHAESGIGFGFRRLSIVDRSELGHQPMQSATCRYTLIFNGEVYNHRDLARQLATDGARFRGHSDTEVILAAFERWGIEAAVRRFIGMFAMAVWDGESRRLTLLRDRLGIKPLFIYSGDGLVTFGSELKALAAGPAFDRAVDPVALTAYLRYLYVPAPRSIYRRVVKLLPGHLITIDDPARSLPAQVPYWSVAEAARRSDTARFDGSDAEAADALERLLTDAVSLRMRADVPVGALLSGGIDSSSVVSLMQAVSSRPVKTYTIGFDVAEHDEAAHAARVAAHLGTEHTELRLSGSDALALIPQLPDLFDEPFADPSQLPTYLVCRLARREVTVALSGDGGDEVFAGYNRYLTGSRLLPLVERLPGTLRQAVARGIGAIPAAGWERMHRAVGGLMPGAGGVRLAGDKLYKLRDVLNEDSIPHMYRSLLSAWQDPADAVVAGQDEEGPFAEIVSGNAPKGLLERMMLADQVSYLPDDLLAKVDRASMAVSLEARVPLLDHRVVEFAWTLPRRLKIRGRQGKWLLRQVLHRRVPAHLVERPKMGFSVPLVAWLRGPLRPWAEALLAPEAIRRGRRLRTEPIGAAWRGFLGGDDRQAIGLWAILVFRAWEDRWMGAAS